MMRLTDLLTGLLAKAMPSLFGHDPSVMGTFDQRKEHLHQETRVDRRGRTSRRWVNNAAHSSKAQTPPASMPSLLDLMTAQPSLFGSLPPVMPSSTASKPAKQQASKTARKPRDESSALPGLFDAPVLPTSAPVPGDPLTPTEAGALEVGALHPGDRKVMGGVTYELNDNHRWTRVDEAATPQDTRAGTVAAPAEVLPLLPAPDLGGMSTSTPVVSRPADPEAEPHSDEWWANLQPGSQAYEHALDDAQLEASVQLRLNGEVPSPWEVHRRAQENIHIEIENARDRLGLPSLADAPANATLSVSPVDDATQEWTAPAFERNEDYQQALKSLVNYAASDKALSNILSGSAHDAQLMLPARLKHSLYHALINQNQYRLYSRFAQDDAALAALAHDLYEQQGGREIKPVLERDWVRYGAAPAALWASVPKFAFDLLERSTRATRRTANRAALALARQIRKRQQPATPEEREILAKWSGQGGVDQDRNAYYTPTKLAAAMWALSVKHGLPADARVLEPSIGGGVFAETRPKGVSMTGVEYNADTVDVARALHPDVAIHHAPFESYNTSSADELFDAVIANPPYGGRGDLQMGTTRDLDKPQFSEAEQYFVDTALDRVKPGGLVTVLVNFGVMQNSSSRDFRARLLARADLVTAVRAPVSTFADSGAMVTPDILVLRKRPEGVGEAMASLVEEHGEDALHWAGVHRDDVLSGEYFARAVRDDQGQVVGYEDGHHPERALGKITSVTRAHHGGMQMAVEGQLDDEALGRIAAMPADSVPSGPRDIEDLTGCLSRAGLSESQVQAAINVAKVDHYPIQDGAISPDGNLIFRNHRWHRISANELPAVRSAISISRNIEKLSSLVASGATQSAEALRVATRGQAEQFVQQFGDPAQHAEVQEAASRLPFLQHFLANMQGQQVAGRLAQPVEAFRLGDEVDVSNPEAVAHALSTQGRLTPDLLADITGLPPADAKHLLIESDAFAWTGQRWVRAEDYFWGDVYQQADAARSLALNQQDPALRIKLERQADRFVALLPRVPIDQIDFSARDKWVPLDVVESWLNDTLGTTTVQTVHNPATSDYDEVKRNLLQLKFENGVYTATPVTGDYASRSTWRSIRENDVQAMLDYLNRRTRVKSVSEDLSPEERAKQRAENVQAAKDREAALKNEFRQWVFGNDAQTTVEEEYNRSVNSYLAPRDLTAPFHLEGWNHEALQPHPFQYATVRKAMAQGSSYIALDVGLGKTSTALMLATKLRAEGRAKKPTVIVPKSVLGQWVDEVERVTPGKKVLVIGLSRNKAGKLVEDSPEVKRQKLAQLAAEEWDLVLTNHEFFESIPMRRETRLRLIEGDFERQRLEGLKGRGKFKKDGAAKNKTQTEAADFAIQQLEKVRVAGETDIAFEDLGIDQLIADEAHNYKNLYSAPSQFGEAIKFLGAGAESNQAMEFQHKSRFVREQNGDGSGVHCMSATPTKNSPLELYYALQFVTDELAMRGVPGVEDFLDRFCELGSVIVPDRSGTLKSQLAVTGFKNLDELRGVMGRYLIRETAQSALVKDKISGELRQGLPMPEREDRQVFFEMDPAVASHMANLRTRAGAINMRAPGGSGDFLRIMDEMTKLSLDPQLVSPGRFGHQANPRFQHAAQIAKGGLDEGGKVVIFMERGESGADGRDLKDNAFTRLKDSLVAQGIPADQIAIVTASTAKGAERTRISQRFQRGELRVVIGNRTIEEGMNLQNGTTDMIHMDVPWDPGTYWQRLGRAHRQGNTAAVVRNHVLLARGSMDQFKYTSMLGKKGWSDTLWDPSIREGSNGDLEGQMDQLQLELSPDRLQAQAQITNSRGEIRAAQRAAAIKRVSADLKTYFLMRSSIEDRAKKAALRKTGPTPSDRAAIERGRLAMNRLREQIHASDYPFKALTDTAGPVLFSDAGIPYHAGMQFFSTHQGQPQPWVVKGVKPDEHTVFAENTSTGERMWMPARFLSQYANGHVSAAPEPTTPTPLPTAA